MEVLSEVLLDESELPEVAGDALLPLDALPASLRAGASAGISALL